MLKGKSNLVLIGFMGSGKTTVAEKLGKKLGKTVVSTDALIVSRQGRSIAEIFKEKGEGHFRALEKEIVKEIAALKDTIIDCGGGIVLDQANIDRLKKNGCLIFLSAGPGFLYEQIKGQKDRPLLQVKEPLKAIKELLAQRASQYAQADITLISEGRTIDEICDEIIELMKHD